MKLTLFTGNTLETTTDAEMETSRSKAKAGNTDLDQDVNVDPSDKDNANENNEDHQACEADSKINNNPDGQTIISDLQNEQNSNKNQKSSDDTEIEMKKIDEEGDILKNWKSAELLSENRRKNIWLLELELAEKKKEILERISFQIKLNNLDEDHHKDKEFVMEVLFASTEDLENCFTLGKTAPQTMNAHNSIIFSEEFEFNFFFERTQYLRILISSNDKKASEVRINLAKVLTSKLTDLTCPVDLLKQEIVNYNGNKLKSSIQNIVLDFKRISHYLDKKIPSFYVDFNFIYDASQVANNLHYEIISVKNSGEIKILHKSNDVIGKNPLYFAAATFEKKDIFEDKEVEKYVFEFYENDTYFGQVIFNSGDMDKLLSSKDPITYTVSNEGKQIHITEKENKTLPLTSSKIKPPGSPRGLKAETNKNIKPVSLKPPGSPRGLKAETNKNIKPLNLSNLKHNNNSNNSNKNSTRNSGGKNSPRDSDRKPSVSPRGSVNNNTLNTSTPVVNPLEYLTGKVKILFKENKRKKFYDLICEGLNTAFDIAIDYTSSNLDPTNEQSLHTLKLENNKYAKAIKSCGNILKEYDDDQLFPVYGFGGVPSKGKEVSHCFNVNGKKNASINGMDEVINSYLNSLKTVQLVGPTYFQHVLKTVTDTIKKEMKAQKKGDPLTYHVCLMLTDGKIEDMNETIEALIEAAKLPISVIIVGIGNDDFGKMETLGKY